MTKKLHFKKVVLIKSGHKYELQTNSNFVWPNNSTFGISFKCLAARIIPYNPTFQFLDM